MFRAKIFFGVFPGRTAHPPIEGGHMRVRLRRVFAGCEVLLVRHPWLPFNKEAARRVALKGGFISVLQALAELPEDVTIRELLRYFVHEEGDAVRFLEAYIGVVSQKCPV